MFTLEENKYQKKGTTFKFYYSVFVFSAFQLFIKFFCEQFFSSFFCYARGRQKKITFLNNNIWGCGYNVCMMSSQ